MGGAFVWLSWFGLKAKKKTHICPLSFRIRASDSGAAAPCGHPPRTWKTAAPCWAAAADSGAAARMGPPSACEPRQVSLSLPRPPPSFASHPEATEEEEES